MSPIRTRFNQAKQFVQRHPTLTACAITAVVTHKVSSKTAYQLASKETLDAASEVVYEFGLRAGYMQGAFDTAMDFLVDNNMLEKFKTDTGMDVVKKSNIVDMVA